MTEIHSEVITASPQELRPVETAVSSELLAKHYRWLKVAKRRENTETQPSAGVLSTQTEMLDWINTELVRRGDEALIASEEIETGHVIYEA